MAQNYPTIDASVPGGDSGASLANKLNQIRATLLSTNSGSVEPDYKAAGTLWIDNAASPWVLKLYDGADWIPLFQVDPATNLPVYTAAGIGSSIHGASAKAAPVDADTMPLIDSEASNALKKVTWANIKATLKTYFDGLTTTLTNKRITPRIGTTASSSTPTPNADDHDQYNVTALAVTATFGAPTGTPTNGQKLILRIKDNGTARALSFNPVYRGVVALPTTTVLGKTVYLGFIYNEADTKWDLVAKAEEA